MGLEGRRVRRRRTAQTMGIEVELDGRTVVGRMPVTGNTQPYGILHGGATAVLVESVGSIAAALSSPAKYRWASSSACRTTVRPQRAG